MAVYTCGNCGELVERDTKTCPQCGRLYPALFGWRPRLDAFFAPHHEFSKMLVKLLVVIYLAMLLATSQQGAIPGTSMLDRLAPSSRSLMQFGACIPVAIEDYHHWWRLVLPNFLHANITHILFNAWSLFVFGTLVERFFGPARFLVVFILGGIGGAIGSTLAGHFSCGASSGICALLGATLGYGMRRRDSFGDQIKQEALRWCVFTAIFGFLAPGIDNAAHLGGGVAGFALSYAFSLKRTAGRESDSARLGAIACGLLVLVAAIFCANDSLRANY